MADRRIGEQRDGGHPWVVAGLVAFIRDDVEHNPGRTIDADLPLDGCHLASDASEAVPRSVKHGVTHNARSALVPHAVGPVQIVHVDASLNA